MAHFAGVNLGSLNVWYALDEGTQQVQRVERMLALVAFSDTDAPYVSDDATLRLWLDYPDRCALGFLRMLVYVHNPQQPSALLHWLPYQVVEQAGSFELCLSIPSPSGERIITAAEILSGYFDELKVKLGRCHRTVLALPACLGEQAASIVEEAARQAGIPGPQIYAAPVALAARLSANALFTNQVVALCDIGGGTFDVAIVYIGEDGAYEVLSAVGDPLLGILDIDMAIAGWLDGRIRHLDPEGGWINSRHTRARLLAEAIALRQLLKNEREVQVQLPFLAQQGDGRIVHFPGEEPLFLNRDIFAALAAPFLAQVEGICNKALQSSAVDRWDISEVLVAGEQLVLPALDETFHRIFGRRPRSIPNAGQATALGAVLLAHQDDQQRPQFGPLSVRTGAPVLAAFPVDQWPMACRIAQRQPLFGKILATDGMRFAEFYTLVASESPAELIDGLPDLVLRLYHHARYQILQLPADRQAVLFESLASAQAQLANVTDADLPELVLATARSSLWEVLERYIVEGVAGLDPQVQPESQVSTFWSWFHNRRGQ